MLGKKTVHLGARAAAAAAIAVRATAPTRSAAAAVVAAAEWEKGSMVFRDQIEERDAAYLKASNANGLQLEPGMMLTEEAEYLSEAARVDYMYKGPCDSSSSLQLNSATQFMVENSGHSQPVTVHYASIGGHVPRPASLYGTGLSHLHFKGASSGLGCKFVSNTLLGAHPSRQFHCSAVARQQGVQDATAAPVTLEFAPTVAANAQGIQGEADSAQARLWATRCLSDGLYTDCALPPDAAARQRKTVQQVFVKMQLDIRSAAEAQLKRGDK